MRSVRLLDAMVPWALACACVRAEAPAPSDALAETSSETSQDTGESSEDTSEPSEDTGESSEGAGESSGDGSEPTLMLAVIGDYGDDGPAEAAVAALVASWQPDHILTLGDNNYNNGHASTIDANIGQHYADYIGDYTGAYGPGAKQNRFWPVPGNHDWRAPGLAPYLDYFTLPGNERYYALALNETVTIFAVDSDDDEPHGHSADSPQAQMFHRPALAASPACWKLVLLHHAPYSSGAHGSDETMRWPFAEWGADLVFAGHDHHYERLEVDGIPYFVNGLGGRSIYGVGRPIPESHFVYNTDYGAQLITITGGEATISFYNRSGVEIDSLTVTKDCG